MGMSVALGSSMLEVVQGNITEQKVDGVVNAANTQLKGGGGVDGAIHSAGGPEIMKECREIGGCPTGEAVVTTAGQLDAKKVIHAVGPRYQDGNHGEAKLLASAYRNAFSVAVEQGLETIATPSLSTGAYGYPVEEAARIAIGTAIDFLGSHPGVTTIRFVLMGTETYGLFRRQLEEQAPTQLEPRGEI